MIDIEIVSRILIAFLLGGIIGIERQWRHRTAGLRTNTLVSIGSALFVILSIKITGDPSPSRIAAQIVSGIGFLGAGVIMKEGFTVRGLNTAATLWCSAAVGSLTGMGFLQIAVMGTIAVVGAHLSLRPIANYLNMRPIKPEFSTTYYNIKICCTKNAENHLRVALIDAIKNTKFQLKSLKSFSQDNEGLIVICADLFIFGKHTLPLEDVIKNLSSEKEVTSVSWEVVDKNDD